jgi:hypothetical protein
MNITRIATFLTSGGLVVLGWKLAQAGDGVTRIAGGAILLGSAFYFVRQML